MLSAPSSNEKYFNTIPLKSLTTLDWKKVSYVGVIAFATDWTMLCINQPHRWIDIPGWHRDPKESPLEVLTRENFEEVGIPTNHSKVILIRESTQPYKWIDKPIMLYSVITWINKEEAFKNFENRPQRHRNEVSEITFKSPEEFIKEYSSKASLGIEFLENMRIALNNAKDYMQNDSRMKVWMIWLGDHNIRSHLVPLNADPRIWDITVFDPKWDSAFDNLLKKYWPQYTWVAEKITEVSEDFRTIIDNNDIQTVFISSPDQFHVSQTTESLNSWKNVFCEKPLIHSLSEIQRLVENILIAKQKGLILSSCHPRRFDPPFMWLKDYINSSEWINKIWNIISFHFNFKYPSPEIWKEWMHSGLLADHFNHEIDLINFMLGFSHFKAEKIKDSQIEYEVTWIREDWIEFNFSWTRKEPRNEPYTESVTITWTKWAITINTETGKAILDIWWIKVVIHHELYTDYITRFELTTGNMIDAILAGWRNYLTPNDLFLNSVSGAALTEKWSFESRDYEEILETISK